jgi:4-alpha-glucanotransferase
MDPAAEAEAALCRLCSAKAPWAITPLQDLLLLPNSARMNTPGTVEGNWKWKAEAGMLTPELSRKLLLRARAAGRCAAGRPAQP